MVGENLRPADPKLILRNSGKKRGEGGFGVKGKLMSALKKKGAVYL